MSLLARMQNTFYSIWMNFMALPAIIMYKEGRYRVGQVVLKIPSLDLQNSDIYLKGKVRN